MRRERPSELQLRCGRGSPGRRVLLHDEQRRVDVRPPRRRMPRHRIDIRPPERMRGRRGRDLGDRGLAPVPGLALGSVRASHRARRGKPTRRRRAARGRALQQPQRRCCAAGHDVERTNAADGRRRTLRAGSRASKAGSADVWTQQGAVQALRDSRRPSRDRSLPTDAIGSLRPLPRRARDLNGRLAAR